MTGQTPTASPAAYVEGPRKPRKDWTEREILEEAYSDAARSWKAPVQGHGAGIPWPLHLEAYDAYCAKWGKQTAMIDLPGRGCRGGFSVAELDDFIPGWRDKVSEIGRMRAEIAALSAQPPAEAADRVEQVARIIAPGAWDRRDTYVRIMTDGGGCTAETIASIADQHTQHSISTAKAVLAALAQAPERDGEG